MIPQSNRSISEWVNFLAKTEIPVLKQTKDALERLQADIDNVSVKKMSHIILDDPMIAVQVMSLLPKYHPAQTSEVTTIGGVLMMVGIYPFFQHLNHLVCIEDVLKDDPDALACVLAVIDRTRFATQYAYDWAKLRFDIDCFEVQMATLLNSTAEIMLWCFAPSLMKAIRALSIKYRHMRSARLQEYVLGFTINELQKSLAQAWKLPELLVTLLDQTQTDNPRVRTVLIASDLARHSANGLDDPALPDDYLNVANLLGMGMEEVLFRISSIRNQMVTIHHQDPSQLDNQMLSTLEKRDIENFEHTFSEEIHPELKKTDEAAAATTISHHTSTELPS